MSKLVKVVGFDPSLRNWGVAAGLVDPTDISTLKIHTLAVLNAPVLEGKQVRQNSKDVDVSKYLAAKAYEHAQDAKLTFAEVPVGSQSARAMASYGICCGVLGALQAGGLTFFEVTPLELKLATVGQKNASKSAIIHWAMLKHPEAPWPYVKRNGVLELSEAKAEHMADAIGSIYAGFKTSPFLQTLQLMN